MKLRTRLILLTSLWILLVLLFIDLFIYYYIQKQTTNNEVQILWNQAQIILRNPDVHDPDNWDKALAKEFKIPDSLIRVIRPDGSIAYQHTTNQRLSECIVMYRKNVHSAIVNDQGYRMLFVQVPIVNDGKQIALLELGRALNVVNFLMQVLVSGLAVASVSVILFSLIGGYFYTQIIIKPLRQLVETMDYIRTGGSFVTLNPQLTAKKDELGKLGQTFNEMIEKLQENDDKQKQFIANASHELKTPLTIIESYASLLDRWGGEDPAIRSEATKAILQESGRLKGLILSLLHLAESEQQPRTEPKSYDLFKLVRTTAGQLSLAAGHRDIDVHSDANEVVMIGYPEAMKQLLIIIIDNAIKYSQGRIEVVLEAAEHEVLLIIKDYGIGISKEHLPHLFERFYRVDQSRTRSTGGSGLGLSIAKPIVERHGGTMDIDSTEGEGTMVTIRLPRQALK